MTRKLPTLVLSGLSLAPLTPALHAQTPAPDDDWLAVALSQLTEQEYHYREASGALSAPNRGQALRSRIAGQGLEVTPTEASQDPWRVHLRTVAVGRGDALTPLGGGEPTAHGGRVELDHERVLEWFENRPSGLEQGWTFDRAPAGDGELTVVVELNDAFAVRVDPDRRGGVLVHDSREVELPYRGLVAFEAVGRDLPAALEATASGFRIRVDDRDARYPVTIDPVLEHHGWSRESNQGGAQLGAALSGIGDVNGDGYDDFAIGAPGFHGVQLSGGRIWVYHGSPSGPVGPVWVVDGTQAGGNYGQEIAAAGDVNGDGYDDMMVSAPFWDAGQNDEGHIWVYAGSPSGLVNSAIFRVEGNQAVSRFGSSLAGLGDVNGDGFDDIAVGAPRWDAGETNEGHVWVYHGSANGPVVPAAFRAEGNQLSAEFGYTLAHAGDVNGDGYSDMAVGAPFYDGSQLNDGRIWVYHGSPSGLISPAAIQITGSQTGNAYGFSVAGIGDVDLDGYDDLAVGCPFFDDGLPSEGQVWVYHGSPSGVTTPATWRAGGGQSLSRYGWEVTGAGDVNGDGHHDLLVGASLYDGSQVDEGRAWLYLGSPLGMIEQAAWQGENGQAGANYGSTLAGIGDMNGDGFDDVLVGAPLFDNPEVSEGAAYLYEGSPEVGTPYCVASFNSTGSAASIQSLGLPSAAAGQLELVANGVPDTPGIFFHGSTQIAVAFGNGIRCVGGAVVRGAFAVGTGNQARYVYDNSTPRRSLLAFVGTTRHFQFWFRDGAAGGAGFNTSNGVSVAIAP